jgi:hypothetical protein
LTAWLTIALSRDGLQDILDIWPGFLVATGHDGRSITSTLFTAGYSSTNESNAFFSKVLCATVGIRVVRVATVDDNVTLLDSTIWERSMAEAQGIQR